MECSKNNTFESEPYLTIAEQIERLIGRKLVIEDQNAAATILSQNSYSSFIRYYGPLFRLEPENKNSDYKEGATIDEIYALYNFNRKIRSLYLEYILIVEHTLKTVIADWFSCVHDPCSYLDPNSYSNQAKKSKKSKSENDDTTPRAQRLIKTLSEEISKKYEGSAIQNTPFEDYSDCRDRIPIWLVVNIISFGTMRLFYNCLDENEQKKICSDFSVDTDFMETALFILNQLRNKCAHDERIHDAYFRRVLEVDRSGKKACYYGVYAATYILKQFLSSEQFLEFYTRLNEYFLELESSLHTISITDIKDAMRFPSDENILLIEMGLYNDGIILSKLEFLTVLRMYILPLIPQGDLEIVDDGGIEKTTSGLVEFDDEQRRLYFSQSNKSPYIVRTTPLINFDYSSFETIENHLREFISSLQIIWNTNKAAALKPREQQQLFSTNAEIAYQLSLCSLLCNKNSPELVAEFNKEKADAGEVQRHELSTEEKKTIRANIREHAKKISRPLSIESKQRETLYCILSSMDQWAMKTYEGKHMPFGVVVNKEIAEEETFDYIRFLSENYSATISDGLYSFVEIYANGYFCKHYPSSASDTSLYTVPYPHQGFAEACTDGKIGVLLTTEGDIILINEQKLFCSKHNGRWTYNLFENAIKLIENRLTHCPEGVRLQAAQEIFHTLIDVSYSHGGACIAIASSEPPDTDLLRMTYPTLLDDYERKTVEKSCISSSIPPLTDAEKETDPFRMKVLRHLVGHERSFLQLNRYLRRELIEMDGALILGSDGKVHAVASIVNTNGASVMSGARTTAAMRLSEYGLAIKVSQDGYMKFYEKGQEILSI